MLSNSYGTRPAELGAEVWYCSPELMTGIEENDLSGRLEILRYNDQKFTMKLEREENRLALLEEMWSGSDKPY